MVKLHKIAGQVMGFFEAFDGSRAALDTDRILIVRGRSSKIYLLMIWNQNWMN